MPKNKVEILDSAPISKAVLFLIIPTVISKLVTVLYNVADTFFIGQLGEPA
jgi:multidrug efflux pump